jgi:hypothetical protein
MMTQESKMKPFIFTESKALREYREEQLEEIG